MPDNDAYNKLKRGLGLAPPLKPEPTPKEEPSFLSGYTNIVTQTFNEAAKKLGEGLHQLNPHPLSGQKSNPIAGAINIATGGAHLGFAPISSAFGVADKGLRDVGLDPVADAVNFAFELPAKTVKKGSDYIEQNIFGVKESAKLLGVRPDTMQEIYDASVGAGELIGTLIGLKGYSAVGKAFKSKFRGKKPTVEEFNDYIVEEIKALPEAQQQKLLANPNIKGLLPQFTEGVTLAEGKGVIKSVREKNIERGYSKTTKPIEGKEKTADSASKKVDNIPLRKGYDKTDTKTKTADINRSETTNVTKVYTDPKATELAKEQVVSEKDVIHLYRGVKRDIDVKDAVEKQGIKNIGKEEGQISDLYFTEDFGLAKGYAGGKNSNIIKITIPKSEAKKLSADGEGGIFVPNDVVKVGDYYKPEGIKVSRLSDLKDFSSEIKAIDRDIKNNNARRDRYILEDTESLKRGEITKSDYDKRISELNKSAKEYEDRGEANKQELLNKPTEKPTREKIHAERNALQNESTKAWLDKRDGKITPEEYNAKIKDINTRAKAYEDAMKNIEEKSLGRTNMFGDPTIIKDYVVVAKHWISQGVKTFKEFAKKMIDKFSDKIKPHLRKIWNETQKEIKTQSPEVKKINKAIKDSKIDRKNTDRLYAEARGQKYAKLQNALNGNMGRKAYIEALKSQKGELPKADFESIANKFTQKEIDNLFSEIQKTNLNGWEQLSAMHGLEKVLGEKGGKVPTTMELELLKRVYGQEFVDAIKQKRPVWDKIRDGLLDAVNIPRALVTSFDMSAALRQGLILTVSRPKQSIPALKAMHKYFFSDKAFKALGKDLETRPNAQLYEQAKLYIAREAEALHLREEAFMSHLAERIPILGHVVRASERAYVGYLNKIRADVFDSVVKGWKKEGITFKKDPKSYTDLANFINLASGRGSLGKYGNRVAPVLNGAFFSIRNLAAKVQLMSPLTYAKMSKRARITATKDMIATVGTVGTLISLASLIDGVTVETDPRSSDFMKIRYKNTRIDPWGGFQQFVRFAAQMYTGETKSSISGKVRELDAKKFPFETRLDRLSSFVGSKVSPQMSIAGDLLRGESMFGEELEFRSEAYKRLSPLYMQDLYEASNELGVAPASVMAMLGFYGAGLQTYGKRKKKAKKTNSSWKF